MWALLSGVHLFDHLLWPIFQKFKITLSNFASSYRFLFIAIQINISFYSELIIISLARMQIHDLCGTSLTSYQLSCTDWFFISGASGPSLAMQHLDKPLYIILTIIIKT